MEGRMSKTQAERRSAIEHELFEITDEMKEAMERARINDKNRYPEIDGKRATEKKNNFREYNQKQSFFTIVFYIIKGKLPQVMKGVNTPGQSLPLSRYRGLFRGRAAEYFNLSFSALARKRDQ